MKRILYLILILVLNFRVFAGSEYIGIKGANFLKIGPSSHSEAMGGSYVSIGSGDINSLYYNPAGLNGIKNIEFQFSTLDWIDNVNMNYLAFGMNSKKLRGIVGGALNFLYLSPVDYYNSWGEVIDTMPFYNMALTLSYARNISSYKTGANLKFIYERIYTKNLLGLALDLGTIYEFEDFSINLFNKYILIIRDFSVGACIRNIGTKIGTDYLPLNFVWGYSFKITKEIKTSVDIIKPIYVLKSLIDSDYKINFGLEYNFKNVFALRLGYKLNYEIPNNFTLGFGVNTKFKNGEIIVDYAYAAYTGLEKTNRITLTLKTKTWEFWK